MFQDIFLKVSYGSFSLFLSEEGVTRRNVGDYYCHLFHHPFVSQIKFYPENMRELIIEVDGKDTFGGESMSKFNKSQQGTNPFDRLSFWLKHLIRSQVAGDIQVSVGVYFCNRPHLIYGTEKMMC